MNRFLKNEIIESIRIKQCRHCEKNDMKKRKIVTLSVVIIVIALLLEASIHMIMTGKNMATLL